MKYCVWLVRWTSICLTIITAVDFLKKKKKNVWASITSGCVHVFPEWYEINHVSKKKREKKEDELWKGFKFKTADTVRVSKDVRLSVSVLYKSCVSVSISTHSLGLRFYVRNLDYLHSSCQKIIHLMLMCKYVVLYM